MAIKVIDPLKDGDPVQYVGVYVTRWRPEWGRPQYGFVETEDADISMMMDTLKSRYKIVVLSGYDGTHVNDNAEIYSWSLRLGSEAAPDGWEFGLSPESVITQAYQAYQRLLDAG